MRLDDFRVEIVPAEPSPTPVDSYGLSKVLWS